MYSTGFKVISITLSSLTPFFISFICCVLCYCCNFLSANATPRANSSLSLRMSANEIPLARPLPMPVSPTYRQKTQDIDIANLPGFVIVEETAFPPSYDDCVKPE